MEEKNDKKKHYLFIETESTKLTIMYVRVHNFFILLGIMSLLIYFPTAMGFTVIVMVSFTYYLFSIEFNSENFGGQMNIFGFFRMAIAWAFKKKVIRKEVIEFDDI